MIDIDHETLVPIKDAPTVIPGRPNLATVYRWFQRGAHGVKLETIVCGTRRFTSREAIARFCERTTAAAAGEAPPPRTPKQREREIAKAAQELKEAGI